MDLRKLVDEVETRIHEPPQYPFIEFISPDKATEPTLKRMYKRVAASRKSVANIHQSQSLMPNIIKNHLDLYMNIMYNQDSNLTRRHKELVATIVSYLNSCKYCITHHYEALLAHWESAPNPRDIILNGENAGLTSLEAEMIKFAARLTVEPYGITEDDVGHLKKSGLDDKDILNLILIISYFNFVNRLALGTGCPLEGEDERNYDY